MILYFADRFMNILGSANTALPKGIKIKDDLKTEDVETGVASFECYLPYDKKTRAKIESFLKAGNYILRSNEDENEFYTIIDGENDTRSQDIYVYAEDAGLDLLNEIVGEYEASHAYPIEHYIDKFTKDSGFKIGINEIEDKSLLLSFDSEETATARVANIAALFGAEISYSFKVEGLKVVDKLINIHEKRGKDNGRQLRLNKELDRIVTKYSISNLATALNVEGGTPDDAENPITLKGYEYDDGDFYISGKKLYSRSALDNWSRYLWSEEPNQLSGYEGHIVKPFSSNALTQAELLEEAIAELKKLREIEVNYEIEFKQKPENVAIGDRVNVIDDDGELYLSTRLLKLETSVVNKTFKATLGEYLLKDSGISKRVEELAAEFAKNTVSVKRALVNATEAKTTAENAVKQAENALSEVGNAQQLATEAKATADNAVISAQTAETKADEAKAAVEKVETSVSSLETTVENAQKAADNAQQAAETATTKAEEAKTAAETAQTKADEASNKADTAKTQAETAIANAETATNTANDAKAQAEGASETAAAAKADAEQAQKDIEEWADDLETYKQTVSAEYTRKTELTETTASLQAQITANANELNVVHTKVTTIDETANDAKEQAEAAQNTADLAQQQANTATSNAQAAQSAADEAKTAANNAQAEADKAKAAAETAQSVADKAETDLANAKADLESVSSRVDATEEEIAAAQQAVATAQSAADKAKQDAADATTKAETAQSVADTANTNAANAQSVANSAAEQAELAQQVADEAKGNAQTAQETANTAKQVAENAQSIANTAKTNAENAQSVADQAAANALTAQQKADDAEAKANQAEADLATAQQNLADVTSRIGATEAEIAEAQEAVETAQAAADKAKQDAATAQSTADTAKANAATAQTAANNAKTAADNAQTAADEAKAAADKAQEDVNNLAVKVTKAETDIKKNSELIALTATKEEVKQTLGGYYTKTEADAALTVKANEINSSVKSQIEEIEVGGRNLAVHTSSEWVQTEVYQWSGGLGYHINGSDRTGKLVSFEEIGLNVGDDFTISIDLNAINKPINLRVDLYRSSVLGENYEMYGTEAVEVGTNKRVVYTRTVTEEFPYFAIYIGNGDTTDATVTIEQYKCLKIEKGNKATAWTPAPEDLSKATEAAANDASNALKRLEAAETSIQQLADNISMLVQKGDKSSQMVFDETSSTWSFDTGEIDENISKHTEDIEELKSGATEANANADKLKNRLDKFEEHISITTYEGEPCLLLFEEDSNYKQYITNTRRIITETIDGVETVKSIVNIDEETQNKVIAKESVKVGGFAWKKQDANRIRLVWEGGTE